MLPALSHNRHHALLEVHSLTQLTPLTEQVLSEHPLCARSHLSKQGGKTSPQELTGAQESLGRKTHYLTKPLTH